MQVMTAKDFFDKKLPGMLAADPAKVHGSDWRQAWQTVWSSRLLT